MTTPTDKLRSTLTRALREVERLRAKVAEFEEAKADPIAIVGIGLRLPGGATTLDEFWRVLAEGRNTLGKVPVDRWRNDEIYDPDPDAVGKSYVDTAGFIDGVDRFDPAVFNISRREAKSLDPQHRLLLEATWHALEDAGVVPGSLADSKTGVFVGIGGSDYDLLHYSSGDADSHGLTGSRSPFAAGRISFTLGLQGPAVSIDTTCSSSLVALHLACASLRARESSLALAAGVQVMVSPRSFVQLSRTRALSPDGRCKTFSANADGYGRGEGVVVLALERLSDAIASGHQVLALVRGSAVNHDGASSSITAPNGTAQRAVLEAALADAGLRADEVSVIECHGTGTKLGDPIEVQALAAVYSRGRPPESPLLLGAVKSNIGHLESAAGLAGVAKVLAALRHQALPATLHASPLNPLIHWAQLNVKVVEASTPWPQRDASPRRAGISAFGLSGTNAHVILEEAPAVPARTATALAGPVAVLLSGHTEAALGEQARLLSERLSSGDEPALTDLGYSLALARTHHARRAGVVVEDLSTLRAALEGIACHEPGTGVVIATVARSPKLAILFGGQGSQRIGMAHNLYESFPRFREALDQVAQQFGGQLPRPLLEVMFAQPGSPEAALLNHTQFTQPALFAMEVAVYRLFESFGVEADILLGHSIGELTAAHVAGVWNLEDACKIVASRARLMQAMPEGGAMISIQASAAEVSAVIESADLGAQLAIAGINGLLSTVVSGDEAAALQCAAALEARGRKVKRLSVSHAFHSHHMDTMLDEFRDVVNSTKAYAGTIPIVSNLTGRIATDAELGDGDYWARQARGTVRFLDGIQTLEAFGADIFLEISPQDTLAAMASGCLSQEGEDRIGLLSSIRRNVPELNGFLLALVTLHCHGLSVGWKHLFSDRPGRLIPLPLYPFQHERFWGDFPSTPTPKPALSGAYEFSGQRFDLPDGEVLHAVEIGPAVQPHLEYHVVYGYIVVPAAMYTATLLAVAEAHFPGRAIELRDIQFVRSISYTSSSQRCTLHVLLEPGPEGTFNARLLTRAGEEWNLHCVGNLGPASVDRAPGSRLARKPADAELIPVEDGLVARLLENGLDHGPEWWVIDRTAPYGEYAEIARFHARADFELREAPLSMRALDNAFALIRNAVEFPSDGLARLPFSIDRVVWFGQRVEPAWAAGMARGGLIDNDRCVADISFWGADGETFAVIEGFTIRSAPANLFIHSKQEQEQALYQLDWVLGPKDQGNPVTLEIVAVIGQGAQSLIAGAQSYATLTELVASADAMPAILVSQVGAGAHEPEQVLAATEQALGLIQAWLQNPDLAASRLLLLTRGAWSIADTAPTALDGAAIWGLVRAAQIEHPDRDLVIVDLDEDHESTRRFAGLLATFESQAAVRGGEILVPRLAATVHSEAEREKVLDTVGTVLLTGATGALGSLLARHLVEHHKVRHLLLVSRSGGTDEDAARLREELEAMGAEIEFVACDVSSFAAVAHLVSSIPGHRPLRAVIHAAGVLADGVIESLDSESLVRVFQAKVFGAWNLHRATSELELSAFVMFSSAAGVLGSAGQANYAAANAYLDSLAQFRRALGLAACSLAWGPWAEGGMATRIQDADRARMAKRGILPLTPEQGLKLFDAVLNLDSSLLVPVQLALESRDPNLDLPPVLRGLVRADPPKRKQARVVASSSLSQDLAGKTAEERERFLLDLVRTEASTVLGAEPGFALDPEQPLQEVGLDSLMAVELRNRLQTVSGLRLASTVLFDYPTPSALTQMLAERLFENLEAAPATPSSSVPRHPSDDDPIAIVGMACRFPGGVETPEELWRLLEDGRDAIGPFPTNRNWDLENLYDPNPDNIGTTYTTGGGFLAHPDLFDPAFFGISPREAMLMDPQQRLLLELSWEALENARIDPTSLRGSRTGVFVGMIYRDYVNITPPVEEADNGYAALGNAPAVLSGRIAYTLGLQGPTFSVDTACSTSLVAMHLACQAIRNGECSMALVGGATVFATTEALIVFARLKTLAADARCKAFSAQADGAGWAEGAGILALERLSDARANGHPVLALVRGTAINQDGRSQGLTAPNGPAQQRVIKQALASGRLTPADVDVVEAHGTGTSLGDPIEAQALLSTYGQAHNDDAPLWLGTVKSNFGHTQAAAGIAGIIKMVLAMQHELLPRTLHVDEPSPQVDWSAGAVRLLEKSVPWPRTGRCRRAGVSSFGVSGTNGHVIVEEAPASSSTSPARFFAEAPRALPFVISGRGPEALRAQAQRLIERLERDQQLRPLDLAYSLTTTRARFEHTASFIADSHTAVLEKLHALANSTAGDHLIGVSGGRPKLGFLFSGQGSQRAGMGRELYESFAPFRAALDPILDCFAKHDCPLREVMLANSDTPEAARIDQTVFTQPALFALEVALFLVLRGVNVTPDYLLGHSIGELAAAHAAEVFSLDDACRLVAARGRLMQALPAGGGMLSIQAGEEEVRALLGNLAIGADIAGINGPSSTVVSGEQEVLLNLAEHFQGLGRKTQRLVVSHAFHSSQMDSILDDFLKVAESVRFASPNIPIVSNVTGAMVTADELCSPRYWVRHLRDAVRFLDGVRNLEGKGVGVYFELGPHGVLSSMAAACLSDEAQARVTFLQALRRDRSELDTFMLGLGGLHCSGVSVNWPEFFGPYGPERIALPTYPFQRERYWVDSPRTRMIGLSAAGLDTTPHPLLGAAVALADTDAFLFTGRLSPKTTPWLMDHVIFEHMIFPGTGFLDLALTVGGHVDARQLEELSIETPLLLAEGIPVTLQISVAAPDADGRRELLMHSRPASASAETAWTLHASGTLSSREHEPQFDLSAWPPLDAAEVNLTGFYERLDAQRLATYGACFRALDRVWRSGREYYAEVALPEGTDAGGYAIHPALLDGALHIFALDNDSETLSLPFAWSGVTLHATGATALRVRLRPGNSGGAYIIDVADANGEALATFASLATRPASPADIRSAMSGLRSRHLYHIGWKRLSWPSPASLGTVYQIGGSPLPGATLINTFEELEHVPEVLVLSCLDISLPLEGINRVLGPLQRWSISERWSTSHLVIFTRRAVSAALGEDVLALGQAPLWGLVRVAQSENPDRKITMVDIDGDDLDLGIVLGLGETQIAIRQGEPLVPRLGPAPALDVDQAPTPLDPAGTVLITGGTGALGSLVAQHLVESHGIRHILLVSRSASKASAARELSAALAQAGVEVVLADCDVADRDQLAAVLASVSEAHPLTGVFHLAGVIDDGVLSSLSPERFEQVFRAKLTAAWHLHELTVAHPLAAFVLFSSLAGVLGSSGQANYAAANAYLDALAAHRHAHGLVATSLAWGAWAQGGMAARLSAADRTRISRQGFPPLRTEEGLGLLDVALTRPEPALVPVRIDVPALSRLVSTPPILRGLVRGGPRLARGPSESTVTLGRRLAGVPKNQRERLMLDLVRSEAASVLALASGSSLDANTPLQELGLDSLMAVELRNRLQIMSGLRLPSTLLFDYPTSRALATELGVRLAEAESSLATVERTEISEISGVQDDPIIIAAMACRFPGGVESPDDLWTLLLEGNDVIASYPKNRGWPIDDLYDPDPDRVGKTYARGGGFLEQADLFDATFFGISPREAESIDPQQRLLLELSWEALERATIDPSSLINTRTGVYVGICYNDYLKLAPDYTESSDAYAALGSSPNTASGRISYTLGLQGPAVSIDTACSSSLVALHFAVQALRTHECDLALVAGATVFATPEALVLFSRLKALSPDGRSKAFSDEADGAGWSEGVGVLVVERLSDARAKGHPILAIVRGSAINQDGRSQGLTAPNGPAQQRVIESALSSASLGPNAVDAVEAHGTGTALGDPIEAGALHAVYGRHHSADKPLWLGSIKSNFGHTQAAAGIAGVMKLVLAMRHRLLPRTLHANRPSTQIDWDGSIQLLNQPVAWQKSVEPRRAGVSSFGISGTNTHVIIEEPPDSVEAPQLQAVGAPRHLPLLLSAKTAKAIREQAARLRTSQHSPLDIAYSLATTRAAMDHFSVEALTTLDEIEPVDITIVPGSNAKLAFLLTGQGAQRLDMGRELAQVYPVFREVLDQIFERFDPHLDKPLREIVFADQGSPLAALLEQTYYTQPALFALEVALFRTLGSWGVVPEILLGHSIGELAAAHVAGIFSLDDACRLVAARGRLMQALPSGGVMISIEASEEELALLLEQHPGVSIAGLNGPMSTVISGDEDPVVELARHFESRGRKTRRLSVSHAFHSHLMEPMLDDFRRVAETVSFSSALIPVVSNVTGSLDAEDMTTPEYWVRQVRGSVRFLDGVRTLEAAGVELCLELGPHGILCSMAATCLSDADRMSLVPALRRDRPETETLALALASLRAHGVAVDWHAYFAPYGARRVELPTYPFQRQRFWLDPGERRVAATRLTRAHGAGKHPLLGAAFHMSAPADTTFWERALSAEAPAWLADHRVGSACLYPGAGFAEIALAAVREVAGTDALVLEDLELQRALVLPAKEPTTIQVAVTEAGPTAWQVTVSEASGENWLQLSSARVEFSVKEFSGIGRLHEVRAAHGEARNAQELYHFAASMGLDYGPAFQGVEALWLSSDQNSVLARVGLPESAGSAAAFVAHPALLDACFQVALGTMLAGQSEGPAVPVAIRSVQLARNLGSGPVWCLAERRPSTNVDRFLTDLRIWDERGEELALIEGLESERLERPSRSDPLQRALLEIGWHECTVPAAPATFGRWLILGEGQSLGAALCAELRTRGADVEFVTKVDPLDTEAVDACLSQALRSPLDGLICLWSLDSPALDSSSPDLATLREIGRRGWAGALNVVKSLAPRPLRDPPRIVLVTIRSQSPRGLTSVRPEQALTWGMGGVLRSEHASLRPLRIDLGALDDTDELTLLVDFATSDTDEDQVAVRSSQAFTARLQRAALPQPARYRAAPADGQQVYYLDIENPGSLDSLHLVACERKQPGPGEVEIAVEAAGVNFLDVLGALGEIPPIDGMPLRLGGECAGRIVQVGANVVGLENGQRVIAAAPNCFATHTTTTATLVVPAPEGLDPRAAATLPVAHMTAYYALHYAGRLRRGERVLIHSAAGGVGIAALQWARHVGAEIYATAGTEEKHEWLRAQGVTYVTDSRSTRFVEDINRWTEGEGVDVVLNALSGPLLEKSFGLLRMGGRFVEIGKRDYFANKALGLNPFLKGLTFTLVDLATMIQRTPDRVRDIFLEVVEHVRAGHLSPLPFTAYPLSRAPEVFWQMGRGRHIGKFVLTTAEQDPPAINVPVQARESLFSRTASYLITGGLGGLGLSVAGWMAEQGAGHLILVGRSGITRDQQREAVTALETRGTRVTVATADVADYAALKRILTVLPGDAPLRGVVHAAGVLDDAMLVNQSLDKFERVLAPKVAGAWNLHLLTRNLELDFFVLYSSGAAVFGSAGQGNYAAANSFLDSLARLRSSQGLPALSLNWGVFSEVGLAAASEARGSRLSGRGASELSPSDGVALLALLITTSVTNIAPCPVDIHEWVEFYPEAAGWPFLEALLAEAPRDESDSGEVFSSLLSATPHGQSRILVLELVLRELARVLRLDPTELDASTPFSDLGVDSLMGVELRNRLKTASGVELPSTVIWTYPSADVLAEHLHGLLMPEASARTNGAPAAPNSDVDAIAQSDVDVDGDEDLLDELEQLEGLLDV